MGGNHNHHNQYYVRNDDPFAKVKFSIPPFNGLYDAETYLNWGMTVEQKFSSHLCHTRFLRPKSDAHRMYAQDQVVTHTVRM
jgi:hypothetical protein